MADAPLIDRAQQVPRQRQDAPRAAAARQLHLDAPERHVARRRAQAEGASTLGCSASRDQGVGEEEALDPHARSVRSPCLDPPRDVFLLTFLSLDPLQTSPQTSSAARTPSRAPAASSPSSRTAGSTRCVLSFAAFSRPTELTMPFSCSTSSTASSTRSSPCSSPSCRSSARARSSSPDPRDTPRRAPHSRLTLSTIPLSLYLSRS